MTALTGWEVAGPTDAELAGAAAAGDRTALGDIYDRYADRLHDFCIGMVRDRETAADCVQDVFCTAATTLSQLRDPDKLRPWLYAIARNEALRCLRARRREQVSDELPDAASCDAGPDTLAARNELAALIAEAAGGLSDRDRAVLELAYRVGLNGPALAEALDVSAGSANRMVSRLRETIERSLGALLVARRASAGGCAELGVILEGWDGQFSILMRKRIARHIESCPGCDEDRRRLVNPVALLGGVPVFIPAPGWLRKQTLGHVQLSSASTQMSATQSGPSSPTRSDTKPANDITSADEDLAGSADGDNPAAAGRGLTRLLAMLVAAMAIALGLALAWLFHASAPITPIGVSSTTPRPSATPVAPTSPEAPPAPPPPPPTDTPTVPSVTVPSSRAPARVPTSVAVVPTEAPAVESPPPDQPPPVVPTVPPPPPPVPGWPPFVPLVPQGPQQVSPGQGGSSSQQTPQCTELCPRPVTPPVTSTWQAPILLIPKNGTALLPSTNPNPPPQ